MSLEKEGLCNVLRCDVPKCNSKYVTMSVAGVVREQAKDKRWRYELRRLVGLAGTGRADICPDHLRILTLVTALVLVALASCSGACLEQPAAPPAPQPFVDVFRDYGWAKPGEVDLPRDALVAGVARWDALGFRTVVGMRPDVPECDWRWYETGEVDCTISIGYHAAPELELREDAGMAIPSRRTIWVDASYTGLDLERIVGHEVGHVLLFAGDSHLPETQHGLMQATFGGDGLTQADRDLACRLIGVCP